MALKIGDIVAVIKADTTEFKRSIREVEKSVTKSKASFKALGNVALVSGTAIATGMSLIAKKAIKRAGAYEQTRIAFQTMLGDAEKANKLLDDIAETAKKTPFQLTELEEGAKRLLAYGVEAEDLVPTLKMLGDVTAGVGTEKMPQLILAFGQISAKGRLMGTELRQLTETGFNLADALGITNGELEAMVSRGEISFEDVRQGFINATTEGGKFYNLMENQSQTFQGQVSNLKDEIELLYREIGEELLPVAKIVVAWARETLLPFIRDAIQWIKDHKTEIESFFNVLWVVIKTTATVVGFVIGLIIDYYTNLGESIHNTISFIIDVFYWFKGIWSDVSMFVRSNIINLVETFETMKNNVINAFKGMYDGIVNWITRAWEKVKEIASKIKEQMDKINPFHKESPSLVENVQAGVGKIIEAYQSLGNISLAPIQHQLVGVGGTSSGSSVVQNINVYPSDGLDIDTIVERLAYKYRTSL